MNYPATSSATIHSLIPVFSGHMAGKPAQLCNGRDLHSFLEVGRDFSTWIKDRITKYGFVNGEDFVSFDSPNLANQTSAFDSPDLGNQTQRGGDRRSRDYHLTLSTAKELSMVENNARGRQARKYFIRCEEEFIKSLKNPVGFTITQEQLTFSINSAIKNAVEDAFAPFKNALFNTIAAPINKRLDNIVSAIQSVPAQAPAQSPTYELTFTPSGAPRVVRKRASSEEFLSSDNLIKERILAYMRIFGIEGTTKGQIFNRKWMRPLGRDRKEIILDELIRSGKVIAERRKKGFFTPMYYRLTSFQ